MEDLERFMDKIEIALKDLELYLLYEGKDTQAPIINDALDRIKNIYADLKSNEND